MAFNFKDSDEQDETNEPQPLKRPGPILHTPKGSNPFAKLILPIGIVIILAVAGYFYYKYKAAKTVVKPSVVNLTQQDSLESQPLDSAGMAQMQAQQNAASAQNTQAAPTSKTTQQAPPPVVKEQAPKTTPVEKPKKEKAKVEKAPAQPATHDEFVAKKSAPAKKKPAEKPVKSAAHSSSGTSHASKGGAIPPKGDNFSSSSGNFVIYVGSFKKEAGAKDTERRWKEAGYPTHFTQKGAWYRVSIGNYPSKEEGKKVAQKMSEAFEDGYWVDVLE